MIARELQPLIFERREKPFPGTPLVIMETVVSGGEVVKLDPQDASLDPGDIVHAEEGFVLGFRGRTYHSFWREGLDTLYLDTSGEVVREKEYFNDMGKRGMLSRQRLGLGYLEEDAQTTRLVVAELAKTPNN